MSKGQYLKFPEKLPRRELNARYREIPLKDSTSRLLRKYFDAMATLYAIIPLYKAKEIILTLSPGLVTEDEFLAFAEIACHECTRYYILGNDALFSNVQQTKPLNRKSLTLLCSKVLSTCILKQNAASRTRPIMCQARSSC